MSVAALTIDGLSVRFGGVLAVDTVSFAVPAGSLAALIGPNGAGKTTLFNLITGVVPANAGNVRLFGESILGLRPDVIAARGLLRTFQSARVFPGMTTLENVAVGAHLTLRRGALATMLSLPGARAEDRRAIARATALLDLVGLTGWSEAPATELPMGAQKLVEICRALMARPRVLLLDEPAAGLNDAETTELATLLGAVRDSGITILIVEHNMSLVMHSADRVVVLDAGRCIADGGPGEVRNNPRVIEAYLGAGTDA